MIEVKEALKERVTFIAGNRKNAGKTTFLKYALEMLREEGPVAFLSIGVDGEGEDLVGGGVKPRIAARAGDLVLTSSQALAASDALFQVQAVFPSATALGKPVLAKITRPGFVELIGPGDNSRLASIIRFIREEAGVGTILVDGAVNRVTQVASIPGAGYVYVTKIEKGDLEKGVKLLSRMFLLDRVPVWEGGEERSEQVHYFPGALTTERWNQRPQAAKVVVAEDFTKVFLPRRQLVRALGGVRFYFQAVLPLRFAVVNLFDLAWNEFLSCWQREAGVEAGQARLLFNPYASFAPGKSGD